MSPGPRIYNLFPLLAGPIQDVDGDDWYAHLDRIAGMKFDWVYVNPFHAPGFSGSLYAIKDPYALHPIVQGAAATSPSSLLQEFIKAANGHGLGFMMDLVINHTSKDALLTHDHPDWFVREPDGELYSPRAIDPADARKVTVWGDLAQLDYDSPPARRGLIAYWQEYLRYHLKLGVRGLRCDAAYQVPAEVWAELIASVREDDDGVIFVAETLGCTLEQVQDLQQAGFDFLYNSSKYWDFHAPWLLEQYELFRRVAPSIAFPESHDTARLASELAAASPAQMASQYRQRYAYAATFSTGVSMPMGFEYGFTKPLHVVETRPQEWAQQYAERRIDLTGFIAAVNTLKANCPALNQEGPQYQLNLDTQAALALLRLGGESGQEGCSLFLLNPSAEQSVQWEARQLKLAVGGTYDVFTDVTPGGEKDALSDEDLISVEPLGFRVLRSDYATAKDHTQSALSVVPDKATIDAIVGADFEDPFAVRGMHEGGPGGWVVVRAFLPGDEKVEVVDAHTAEALGQLDKIHADGFFAGVVNGRKKKFAYRLRVTNAGIVREFEDTYDFLEVLGEMDVHLLSEGTHQSAYDKLGAHFIELGGVAGVAFAVWAPNARRVSVVGDFNLWDGRAHPMRLRHECGVWELFVPGLSEGLRYKYEIKGAHGELLALRADPYGFCAETPPQTASVLQRLDAFQWSDDQWMAGRAQRHTRDAPIAIYEVHLGSWRRMAEEGNRYLTYRELAETLIPYVKDLGFTHLELLPISEYPFDGSWGYQPIGLFAPTSRFGTPRDFAYFVDCCHRNDIGVLIDWVPGHFPSDPHGLAYFDGTYLYEHADPRQGFHQDWNTLIYNYGRKEVASFLLNNASFWLDRYRIDGLRVDAVASMLYLDYSRDSGEWIPNRYGGNENLEAIDFLRRMNELIYGKHEGVMSVAEESTAWPSVSQPTYLGGLGFGYKWNMGWMHDTLQYMSRDPIYRRYHHQDITLGLSYAFSENFVLPLSHDEVVHGKGSLLSRMPGDAWQQFANLRAYYAFMWTHPGKKLLFMGGEFAQGREWNHDAGLDWHLLDVHWHAGVQQLLRDLNHLYRTLPALHRLDCEPEGFQWVRANDSDASVYAFLRRGRAGDAPVLVVCNFTPVPHPDYRLGVPFPGEYAERLNTDAAVYGGSNLGNAGGVHALAEPLDGLPCSIRISVPPLATVVFEHARASSNGLA